MDNPIMIQCPLKYVNFRFSTYTVRQIMKNFVLHYQGMKGVITQRHAFR